MDIQIKLMMLVCCAGFALCCTSCLGLKAGMKKFDVEGSGKLKFIGEVETYFPRFKKKGELMCRYSLLSIEDNLSLNDWGATFRWHFAKPQKAIQPFVGAGTAFYQFRHTIGSRRNPNCPPGYICYYGSSNVTYQSITVGGAGGLHHHLTAGINWHLGDGYGFVLDGRYDFGAKIGGDFPVDGLVLTVGIRTGLGK